MDATRLMGQIMCDLVYTFSLVPGIKPADLAKPGDQISLFIGPCLYCMEGYVPHLPHVCPSCGIHLKRTVAYPWWVRGTRSFLLYRKWMVFQYRLRSSFPELLVTAWDLTWTTSAKMVGDVG